MAVSESWTKKYLAEMLGTLILVFFGDSFNAWAVSGPAGSGSFNPGLLGAGIFWGFAVTFAIYAVGSVSGAHINPAVTVALALRRGFPWSKVPGYIASQLVGAFLGAATVSFAWGDLIARHEATIKDFTRGGDKGVETALIFHANWPHPLLVGHDAAALASDPWWRGAGVEIIITACLLIFILGIVEDRVPSAANLAPLAIGFAVAALVGLFAPIEMASLNPARDLGPRVWELFLGYGSNALPGQNWNVLITTLLPFPGAILGAFIYDTFVHQHLAAPVGPASPERAAVERARA